MTNNFIVTVDGPAASGKSTIAKKVASDLSISYIDSGAMFRAITLYMLENNIDVKDEVAVKNNLDKIDLDMSKNILLLNGKDIESKIRKNKINQNVSYIAMIKEVRDLLLSFQREIAKNKSIIMDGRDIGSVIFPDADYKFFLTATAEERAKRRFRELELRGEENLSFEQVLAEVIERDKIDSTREYSPLVKASDALEIDTTDKSIDQIVNCIVSRVKGV